MKLVRPDLLIATVGLVDSTLGPDRWISVDQAVSALGVLPANPSIDDYDRWGQTWANTLERFQVTHNQVPTTVAPISELMLLTQMGGYPLLVRYTVSWTGTQFVSRMELPRRQEQANMQFSGYCRILGSGMNKERDASLTTDETAALEKLRLAQTNMFSLEPMKQEAKDYELEYAAIDQRLHGTKAWIAEPYATAEWDSKTKTWKTAFNDVCIASNKKTTTKKQVPISAH